MWAIFVLIASIGSGYFIMKSINDYYEFDFFTKTRLIDQRPMIFPAITICPTPQRNTSLNIDKIIFHCKLNELYDCANAFELIHITHDTGFHLQCLKLNGGKNNQRQSYSLFKTNRMASESGLILGIYLSQMEYIFYYLSDNYVMPTLKEIGYRYALKNTFTDIIINKLVQKKLGEPYNKCKENLTAINSFDSSLYRLTMLKDGVYRQKNCYVLCIHEIILKKCNVSFSNGTKWFIGNANNCAMEIYNKFDYDENCSKECPLECETTTFSIEGKITKSNVKDLNKFQFRDKIAKNFNINNLSNETVNKNIVWFEVNYEDLQYTEISQIPKTTVADLVSSLGGIIGVFMGLSLLSLIEWLQFFLEVFFIIKEHLKEKLNF